MGDYVLGRITKKPVLTLALPVKDAEGKIAVVLVTGLKTDWLTGLLGRMNLPAGAQAAVIDRRGRLLAHNPPRPGQIGKEEYSQLVSQKIGALREGVFEGTDYNGQERIFGFTRLGKDSGAIYVLFSIPEKAVFAEADSALIRDIALIGLVTLLALLVAWFVGTASVVRPVRGLLEASQKVAAGDLEARVDGSYGAGELGLLAQGFNNMAHALQQRQREQELSEKALEHKSRIEAASNRVFREALNCETEEELAQRALAVFEDVTGSRFGFIGEVNSEGRFDTIGISNPGWGACEIDGSNATMLIQGMELRGIWAMVIKTGAAQIVNDPSSHPDRVGVPEGHPELTSFLGVPLMREDRPVGMIALANKQGGYDSGDQQAAEALAMVFYEALLRKRLEVQVRSQSRIKAAQAELAGRIAGNPVIETLCAEIITFLCERLRIPTGLIYVADDQGVLKLAGSHAHRRRPGHKYQYKEGEGLVGQAARAKEPVLLDEVPGDYFPIESGLGEMLPTAVMIKPVVHNNQVRAVLELGLAHGPGDDLAMLLEAVNQSIAAAIESAQAREVQANLLEESQAMSEELQSQQEELKTTNEELEEQTLLLKSSEEKLKAQQEELQVTNEELEEKNELLGRQKADVEQARQDLQEKAQELALASKYKSEFLANMSHELRTPLNSLLLLAQALTDNKEGNLSQEQVEYAQIIHSSGSDLLNLINEILDLAKIEAGRVDLNSGRVPAADLAEGLRASFGHMARQKGLDLEVVVKPDAPAELSSDKKRIEQILKNLVSNAIKFTEQGGVKVAFHRPRPDLDRAKLDLADGDYLAVSVRDTGIGIEPKQQKVIFEAFQQADGSTSRRYGGTGLGLSISRELAHLLGGAIELQSQPGQGATFTVYLPLNLPSAKAGGTAPAAKAAPPAGDAPAHLGLKPKAQEARLPASAPQIDDDREALSPDDRVILIVEDDPNFAKILYNKCHDKGFKCLAAASGEDGLRLAREYVPDAVILDLHLPGLDGWSVLEGVKEDTRTRHIPVHIMSVEQASSESLRKGAVGHATKPITNQQMEEAFAKLEKVAAHETQRVLVVEDDPQLRRNTVSLIGGSDVEVDEVESAARAMEALRANRYDCVVLDLGLPDMDGRQLLEKLQQEGVKIPPVIVHTARDISREEEAALRENAESIIIKDVRSQERLLDEVSLFLHRMVSKMPARKRQIIRNLYESDTLLAGKKVLVVDDDMRTTFAVSALLSELGMKPLKANNGQKALQVLENDPDVDLVLMDIMMPIMDGYQAMEQIRSQERFGRLPIIALTAKAMPVDREKCLAAGANDYLPKPVDRDKLVSMIRVWLYR